MKKEVFKNISRILITPAPAPAPAPAPVPAYLAKPGAGSGSGQNPYSGRSIISRGENYWQLFSGDLKRNNITVLNHTVHHIIVFATNPLEAIW